jgi:perosamine synthetase
MYRFVENLKSDRAFYCYSGSYALCLLLKAMEIGKGDQVILQSFTCPAVPSSVVYVGATPVYVDIDPITFNMDPNKLEALVTKDTKAIIIQHTFGIPAEMESILTIAHKFGLRVIEDACHALGSRYHGQEVGEFGDAAIYSFGWYKPIVLGTGGAAVVNDPDLMLKLNKVFPSCTKPSFGNIISLYSQYFAYETLFRPRWFWLLKEIYRRLRDFNYGPRKGKIAPLIFGYTYQPHGNGQQPSQRKEPVSNNGEPFNLTDSNLVSHNHSSENLVIKKMVPLQEKRLFKKLDHWDLMVERQKQIVAQYKQNLSRISHTTLELGNYLEPVYYKYPLLLENKKEIFERAQKEHVEMSDMFGSPLYPSERRANWQALGYEQGMCPFSERASDKIVALPVRLGISNEDIERTITFLISCSN